MNRRYLHDHDEELGAYWFSDPPANDSPRAASTNPLPNSLLCNQEFWIETGNLVREYLALQAGAAYSETLRRGFVTWLRRSPTEHRQYIDGDDMERAALVDWFLRFVR